MLKGSLLKTITVSCMVHILRDIRTQAHSLGEGVEINVSQCLGHLKGHEEPTVTEKLVLERDSLTQPCLLKVADISSNCCFMAVP